MIRPATEWDIGNISAIYSHYVRTHTATFEIDPPDAGEIARRWSAITSLGLPYLVHETEGVVRGFAYAAQYRPRLAYRFTVEDSIYIDPNHIGRGLGRALLTDVIAHSQAAGMKQMIAVVGDAANEPSIRLHESLGFRQAGVLKSVGFKFDRWLDTVILQRSLGG